MSDGELRALERRWRESGALEDEVAYLRARQRAGELSEEALELLAHLVHPASCALLGLPGAAPTDLTAWLSAFERFGLEAMSRAVVAIGWRLHAVFASLDDPPSFGGPLADLTPAQALMAYEEWVLCPCDAHEHQARSYEASIYHALSEGDHVDAPRHLAAYAIIYARRCRNVREFTAYAPDLIRMGGQAGMTGVVAAVQETMTPWALGRGDPLRERVEGRQARSVMVVEDTPGRVARIRAALGEDLVLRHHMRRRRFMTWARVARRGALISLDYHLGTDMSGLDAAQALAQLKPFAPVILHSSDSTGARAQEEILREAGWTTERFVFNEYAWAAALARLVPA